MPPQDITVNSLVVGYEILEKCSETDICVVWKGKHKQNGSFAAIKVLKSRWVQDGKNQLLEAEGEILCNLSNNHIVRYLQQTTRGNIPILVIKYVSNNSLKTIIEQLNERSKLNVLQITGYLQQIEDAISYIHAQGIIHCDLKPEHFLLDDHENIVLCDFGQAVKLSPGKDKQDLQPQPQGWYRDPKYMAPEQKEQNGGYHCYASDQYALGIVVCELLCGKFLEQVPQNQEEWMKLGLPSTVIIGIMAKALAQEPQERYPDIKTFIRALSAELKIVSNQSNPFVFGKVNTAPQQDATPEDNSPNLSVPGSQQPSDLTLHSSPSPVQQRDVWKVVVSRRTLFTLMDVATFGVLGYSWTRLEPKIADILVPPTRVVRSVSSQQFGSIYTIYHGHRKNVNGITWSPDNKYIASGSFDNTIQIWNAINGLYQMSLVGHTERVNDVAWSPDGSHIVSSSGESFGGRDNTVRLWNADNGRNIFTLGGHKDLVNAVAWSPDGTMIASASFDHTVIIWEASNGKKVFTYSGHASAVFDVTWSPDGKYIASCSTTPEKEVHIWDASTGQPAIVPYTGHTDDVLSVSWISMRDGSFIASGSKDKTIHIWSPLNGKDIKDWPSRTLNAPVSKVSWSPKGRYIAAGTRSGEAYVWSPSAGQSTFYGLYEEKNQSIFGSSGENVSINALAWSPDGTMIATGGSDSSVQVWSSVLTNVGNS